MNPLVAIADELENHARHLARQTHGHPNPGAHYQLIAAHLNQARELRHQADNPGAPHPLLALQERLGLPRFNPPKPKRKTVKAKREPTPLEKLIGKRIAEQELAARNARLRKQRSTAPPTPHSFGE